MIMWLTRRRLLRSSLLGAVGSCVHPWMITYDEHSNPLPQLATQWEVSKDGLSIAFRLRAGVASNPAGNQTLYGNFANVALTKRVV